MLNDQQMYCIHLEDYSYPRYAAVTRRYFGTMDDIKNLMERLSCYDGAQIRYKEMIDGINSYSVNKNVTHMVVGKEFQLLTPMSERCRQEFQLKNQEWTFKGFHETIYPMKASRVDVCQTLLEGENEICRCLKATFYDLCYCMHNGGWLFPDDYISGFPGMITYSGNNKHEMNLYACQQSYDLQDYDQAMKDMMNPSCINLSDVCVDLLGEV